VFTILSIAAAFVLFGILQSVSERLNSPDTDLDAYRLWVGSRVSEFDLLPLAHLRRIEGVQGVERVTHLSFFGGYFQTARNSFPSFATDVTTLAQVYPELNLTPEHVKAMAATRIGALVGRPLAERFGWKVGDQIPIGTTIWTQKSGNSTWTFQIVGIVDSPKFAGTGLARALWINYAYFDEARVMANGKVGTYVVRIDDPRQLGPIGSSIDRLFHNSRDETRTQSENARAQAQVKQIADIDFIVKSVVGAAFFALLFVVGNTMVASVRERIPELGVLKTIGFANGTLLALVLAESAIICICASILGLALARVLMPSLVPIPALGHLTVTVSVSALAIAVVMAILAGLPPAIRAMQLKVVDAVARH
jgi:putative ABC transport system permease protein